MNQVDEYQKPAKKPAVQSSRESEHDADDGRAPQHRISQLQNQVGNQAVKQLIAQRQAKGEGEVSSSTEAQINAARGSGQSLDSDVEAKVGDALGQDLSDVRVHTDSESDQLNSDLNARAFATGNDIFFSEGSYSPHTSDGQELIAHELTHVVQQGTGQVIAPSSGMTVNEPGDVHEQEADRVASSINGPSQGADIQLSEQDGSIQRQEIQEEEESALQMQEEEEDMLQMQEEEEDFVQTESAENDEEELLT